MKVSMISKPHPFTPIELYITIESEEERRGLYAIFNYSPNADVLPAEAAERVRDAIGPVDLRGGEEIANGITYDQFFRPKQ